MSFSDILDNLAMAAMMLVGLQHHKHLTSTNLLEGPNEKIKRRTHVVRIFP